MALVVSPEYGYVIATAVATCFQYSLQAAGVAKIRYTAINREYLEKHFSAENEGKCPHPAPSTNVDHIRYRLIYSIHFFFFYTCTYFA